MTEHVHEPIGDETLRLISSVQGLAQGFIEDWSRHQAEAPAGDPDGVSAAATCQWCPLCQFVALVQGERPEISARVAEAGTAVLGALRAVLDAAAEASSTADRSGASTQTRRPSAAPRPRVQRIDLSDN